MLDGRHSHTDVLPISRPDPALRDDLRPPGPCYTARMDGDTSELQTRRGVTLPASELEFSATRSAGPGGQKVNKTSTAIQLRFDIRGSSALTADQKEKMLAVKDQRLTTDGVLVIKAQQFRSQKKNRDEAISRLVDFIDAALEPAKPRRRTRPGKAVIEKRLANKANRSRVKALRRPPDES